MHRRILSPAVELLHHPTQTAAPEHAIASAAPAASSKSPLHLINQVGDDWALSGPSAGSGRHRLQGSESFLRTHPRQLCVVLVCHSVCHSYLGRNSLRG